LAPALAEARPAPAARGLLPRVVSAVVLAVVAIAALWAGPAWLAALIAVVGAIGGWEWSRLTRLTGAAVALPALAAPLAAGVALVWGGALALAAAVAALALAGALWALLRDRAAVPWLALGVAYIGLPTVAVVWLRGAAEPGAVLVLWLFAVVWTTDIAAYFAGRGIGGPRLAPRWSPHKTWAGLLGGMAGAALVAGAVAGVTGLGPALPLAALGAVLALAAQGGDLFESVVKRRFGAKDSGTLIPGHGGVLDRIDGLMAAGPVLALAVWLLGDRMAT